jgi:predicted lipid-binding transport protein (Tim44 family)
MSRYNLTDLYEGMTNDEFSAAKEADRLEAHPDRDKIKAIQAMIAKERESKNSVKEMTGEAYNRIDGLINQSMKNRFLNGFQELYMDMVEAGDMFDVMDVINYLSNEMQDYAKDTKMDQGGIDYDDENFSDSFIDSNLEEGDMKGLKMDLMNFGTESEVDQYMDSLAKSGDVFDSNEDYIEDFKNYIADKSIQEHFGRFLKDYQ